MTRRMMKDGGYLLSTIPPKQPTPKSGQLPSKSARTFYAARRIKIIDGLRRSIQNHMTGSIITDFYGRTYQVAIGGPLLCTEN